MIFWCPFEILYRVGFYFVNNFKRAFGNKRSSFFRVISVGNLSVGGTGKSVFVQFLVKELGKQHCAIALRGYKSKLTKTGQSFLISDGKTIFYDVEHIGDEAFMLAQNLGVPVVIGKNRARSCVLLEGMSTNARTYLILDDAYQHHTLAKDFEVLLLDARHPFENGHCLPAGRLREKDYTRASVIVLTHADAISEQERECIKTTLLTLCERHTIFCGKHVVEGIYYLNQAPSIQFSTKITQGEREDNNIVRGECFAQQNVSNHNGASYLVFAGIGSFSNFVNTVQNQGIEITHTIEYKDHYVYTKKDLENIIQIMQSKNINKAITTSKDWVKIEPLIKKYGLEIPVYVVRVGFEFLSAGEYDLFMKSMREKL